MQTIERAIVRASPLLGAKLNSPAAVPQQVLRQAALDQLCTARGVKLVLLRAPAGFGKSTLMLQYRQRLTEQSVATAWLTLDRSDNDASRFLAGLEAAVAVIAGDVDDAHAPREDRTVGDIALQVIARLTHCTEPFALFLDDFETIQEAGVLGLLREIVDHLPASGQLILGSRSLPDLRLGRLRARGQLLELDASWLRFSPDETTEFFTERRKMALTREDLARLHHKTEGWIAALWLASVALERSESRSEFIDRFSGTDQSVADYLAEDVLARQAPGIRDFLLRTSILKHLEPPLCDALVPGVDSRQILHGLETTDVLLIPIANADRTYRYHSLFARFLQSQLAPDLANRLHSAAARWYEAQGRPVPAIEHALEGGEFGHAVDLMVQHAAALLSQGRMRLLVRWFSALPPDALTAHPELQLIHMWAVCFTRGPQDAADMLKRSGLEASNATSIAPHVRALRPTVLAMMDRYEDAYAVGRHSLEHLPSDIPFADNALANAMATIVSVMGEHDRARRLIDAARHGQGSNASEFNQMYSEAAEGMIDLQEGRLRQATARFRIAVTTTPGGSYGHTNGNAWAGVPYAAAIYESNQIDQAAHLLQVYLPLARDVGLPDHLIVGYVTLSRIAFWRGDVDQALQLLTELEYVGHKGALRRVVVCAKLERAHLQLLQGHHRAARDEIDRAEDPAVWERVSRLKFLANDLGYLDLARLHWDAHAGDPRQAVDRLREAEHQARRDTRHRRALKIQILLAAALHRAGETAAAGATMDAALRQASAEGFIRIVLDEGEIVRPVIHELAAALKAAVAPLEEPVFVDYVQRMAVALGPVVPAQRQPEAAGSAVLLEPLTRKEIRVMQLLAEGYSNNSMAEKLFVSDSTIRTHLRNINTKLDAHSRTQAVAMARRLGVIR